MFNIQKAVSRLDYAPKLKEIEITDIKKGLGVFTPKPEETVSFNELKQSLKKAGYTLASADITIAGRLSQENGNWIIVSDASKQKFRLEGKTVKDLVSKIEPGLIVEITGSWKTADAAGGAAYEVVDPVSIKKIENGSEAKTVGSLKTANETKQPRVRFLNASYGSEPVLPDALREKERAEAPIHTTSPGLTVFQGGAITPRLYYIRQHLGDLNVSRQMLDISLSYTPTERLQLEVQVPVSRLSYDDGHDSGSGFGLGNVTLWGKYRFFRTVKTYGDRQASARFGLELPTGKKNGPNAQAVNASPFIRAQLTPISGGLSPRFDLSFSQAGGRFIFGGNVEGIVRGERDGFRTGHELRVNTDFEYVLLPFDYRKPGKELFLILETNFVTHGRDRLNGQTVAGSTSTEFYISPGLQYAAHPQFVVEGSMQIPVFRNTGLQVLRTDLNVLLGIRYLF